VLTTRTLEGTRMIRSPKFTWTIAPRYQFETEQGVFTVAANLYHSSRYYWDAQNRLFQPAYTELSGDLGWRSPNDRYRLSVWGRNLTSAKVFQHMLPGSLSDSVVYERPASYGVTARVNF
jgi:iron complex outermembrane receptor protein